MRVAQAVPACHRKQGYHVLGVGDARDLSTDEVTIREAHRGGSSRKGWVVWDGAPGAISAADPGRRQADAEVAFDKWKHAEGVSSGMHAALAQQRGYCVWSGAAEEEAFAFIVGR